MTCNGNGFLVVMSTIDVFPPIVQDHLSFMFVYTSVIYAYSGSSTYWIIQLGCPQEVIEAYLAKCRRAKPTSCESMGSTDDDDHEDEEDDDEESMREFESFKAWLDLANPSDESKPEPIAEKTPLPCTQCGKAECECISDLLNNVVF